MELEIRLKCRNIAEKLVLVQQDYSLIFIKWTLGSANCKSSLATKSSIGIVLYALENISHN